MSQCDVSSRLYAGLGGGVKHDAGAHHRFGEAGDGLCDLGGFCGSTLGLALLTQLTWLSQLSQLTELSSLSSAS